MKKFSYKENYWKVFSKSTTVILWLMEAALAASVFTLAYKAQSSYWYYFCMGFGLGSVHFILCILRRFITYQSWVIDTYQKIVDNIIDGISKEVQIDEIPEKTQNDK